MLLQRYNLFSILTKYFLQLFFIILIANILCIIANYKAPASPPLIFQVFTSFMSFLHCFSHPRNRVLSILKGYLIGLESGQCHTPLLRFILISHRLSKVKVNRKYSRYLGETNPNKKEFSFYHCQLSKE